MSFLLDTDTFSQLVGGRHTVLLERIARLRPDQIVLSVITRGEVLFGHALDPLGERKLTRITELFGTFRTLPMPAEAGDAYGKLRAQLTRQGRLIGPNDLWLAAHALAGDLTLVTNNTREFKRVPGLKLANWME